MPPRAKFSRTEIVDAAMELVRKDGIESVTARELGAALGSSARPIFTVFSSMDELKEAILERAKAVYKSYVKEGLKEPLAFQGVGAAYIQFAVKEPELFRLLFMMERGKEEDVGHTLVQIDESYEEILESVQRPYDLKREEAEKLYRHLWVYSHGIATMCATSVHVFRPEEVRPMMTEIFRSLLSAVKRGELV
ncbi:MAG: TetR/AcrR family transcriptional regulator [Blautia sp.]|nr:TetR/AcrR family transcriptional regulator [Blautia sp.]